MLLAQIRIENFRIFGEGENALTLSLTKGFTAIVGENDSGKTAIIDALRLVLGTRDQEALRLDEHDFHQPPSGDKRTTIRIRCKFEDLTAENLGSFAEYLTYEGDGKTPTPVLYVNWHASESSRPHRHGPFSTEVRSGVNGDGPFIDTGARSLLCATYLRPLRDAERAMASGRRSRLSQILQHTDEVQKEGMPYDPQASPVDPKSLSVIGIGDFANALLRDHQGVKKAGNRLNADYLTKLSFVGSTLQGQISVNGIRHSDDFRLRQLLEKLELELRDEHDTGRHPNRGLGSNNVLFMACELLLLGSEDSASPLLVIEEPEAHLHPQRQLLLIRFLKEKASKSLADGRQIQVLVTTHSPTLASVIDLNNLVLLRAGRPFSLTMGQTKLDASDYGFLGRFLDSTKANMFFARGVLIVEGDAENVLLPVLARLIGHDLGRNGVSIVNVGGVGLRRYARVYQRAKPENDGEVDIPVACVTDLDVMPDCAPLILGLVSKGQALPEKNKRRWRVKADFTPAELDTRRNERQDKASEQQVETFVSDYWTLEYDLAIAGLEEEMWLAACLAKRDEDISAQKTTREKVEEEAKSEFKQDVLSLQTAEERASRIYKTFHEKVSKPTAAQYFASILEQKVDRDELSPGTLKKKLPRYLVSAIEHVTVREALNAAGPTGKDSTPS